MTKTITFAFILLGFMILSLFSCKHDSFIKPLEPKGNDTHTSVDTGICFERDILPIFTSNCAMSGCHDVGTASEGFVFNNYENITSKDFTAGNPYDTELFEKITEDDPDKIMPPPPREALNASQIALIKRWIEEGAKNSSGCNSNGCDTSNVTFGTIIQPIINTNCKGCHNTASAGGGFNFEAYDGIKAAIDANKLLGSIKHLSGYIAMPQGGRQLSDCNIRQIEIWIADGALNN